MSGLVGPFARVAAASVLALAALPAPGRAQADGKAPVELPARLIAGRFYVFPVTEQGETLTLFTDTGGGLWLAADVVSRLGLATRAEGVEGADTVRSVALPALRRGASIPAPLGRGDGRLFVYSPPANQGFGSTGATARVPDSVVARFGGGPRGERATSFITTEVFDRWRKRHPDWRVIEGADALPGMAAIEVPVVSVGGFEVGPVWFTQRPDRSFHSYMAQFMDRPTDGALGGSALQYFRVTVDYPNAVAVFERP